MRAYEDLGALIEMAEEEEDDSLVDEIKDGIRLSAGDAIETHAD